MGDIIDRADKYVALETAARIREIRAAAQGKTDSLADTCADCGEHIPPARRLAVPGCTRCVACQTEAEGK